MKSKRIQRGRFLFQALGLLVFLDHAPARAQGVELANLLVQKLGVTEQQATGGAGSIFQVAKNALSGEDFSQIANVVPGIDQMLGAAPELESSSGFMGGITSLFGGGDKLEGMAALQGAFEKLGLSSGMAGQFVPIVLDYVREKGGDAVMKLLQSALV
jgi:hypothetical protein